VGSDLFVTNNLAACSKDDRDLYGTSNADADYSISSYMMITMAKTPWVPAGRPLTLDFTLFFADTKSCHDKDAGNVESGKN